MANKIVGQKVYVTNPQEFPAGSGGGGGVAATVAIDQTTPGTTNAVRATNLPAVVDTNAGNKSASTLRVTLATDQANVPVAVQAGSNVVGKVGIDQAIPGTTNLVAAGQNGTWRITGALNQANGQVTATTTAGTLIIARATRASCLIRNTDTTNTVYIGAATVTPTNGMPLGPGESFIVSAGTLIQVITSTGTAVVAIFDEYN